MEVSSRVIPRTEDRPVVSWEAEPEAEPTVEGRSEEYRRTPKEEGGSNSASPPQPGAPTGHLAWGPGQGRLTQALEPILLF